ncbi:MAG TPA: histidine kinase dimerization/phosphoacceptor domain -containing protein [Dongiaceae bacterium]|nr:histidine kinase dimerization/phosphoacceptor domain -containing protein [Dongiaceae bacterium]
MSQAKAPRLLYIDHDAHACRAIEKALAESGFEVVLASHGTEGLDRSKAMHFDAIGIGPELPDYPISELLAAIRMQPESPAIVYLAGASGAASGAEALQAGANEILVKDSAGQFLIWLGFAFRAAIEKRRLQREKDQIEQEMREANARLEQLNAKQAILLREMNHRIGNSLQLIISMIRMQATATKDTEARHVLQQAVERIIAVSQVHQRLYSLDDVQYVQLRPYINQILADHKITAEVQNCHLAIDIDNFRLETDRAIALGIIVTELVTNALRHAYSEEGGPVRVALSERDSEFYQLTIQDEGKGLGDTLRGGSVGSRIVDGMAKRLKSQIEVEPTPAGTKLVLRFPKLLAANEQQAT